MFEKMIVGEPLAKISAALTKSECVSLETLVEMLDEESKSWNDKQFLPVAETLAALAESDNISVVRIMPFLISVGEQTTSVWDP